MIDWNDFNKFMSGFIIPILFVVIIFIYFLVMVLRKYRIESWEDLKSLVRLSVIK